MLVTIPRLEHALSTKRPARPRPTAPDRTPSTRTSSATRELAASVRMNPLVDRPLLTSWVRRLQCWIHVEQREQVRTQQQQVRSRCVRQHPQRTSDVLSQGYLSLQYVLVHRSSHSSAHYRPHSLRHELWISPQSHWQCIPVHQLLDGRPQLRQGEFSSSSSSRAGLTCRPAQIGKTCAPDYLGHGKPRCTQGNCTLSESNRLSERGRY